MAIQSGSNPKLMDQPVNVIDNKVYNYTNASCSSISQHHKQTLYYLIRLIMNNMYTVVLFLIVFTSTSSTFCLSSNNAGGQEIFMVVDDETTVHDAGMGTSKANPVQIGQFLLEDGNVLTLSRKSSPSPNCIGLNQPCGALHWCCAGLVCDGVFSGRCQPSEGCRYPGTFCGVGFPCCPPYQCDGGPAGALAGVCA
ncbi:hypothetical protein CTI12_AA566010 [Artemisia annua]|uniref:Uncharacterized protein n=1 Tax=Artemisia annua TaxID=35608 RepID=A0A2U1KTL9_ARTAN|nr:hypothetical protein CTI12_AA566010 [Artemisia annua]